MATPVTKFATINPHAAGIDLGSEKIYVAVEGQPVRHFESFTHSLAEMVSYLRDGQITSVAIESTGVLWMPVYDALESAGIEVYLVNGAHVKHLPGRKSDVQDCQWLQQLHRAGLLRRSFVPDEQIRMLRTYVRLRADHITMAAQHVQHMHKALDAMNLKLSTVISQIHGASGMRIIRAILDGERNAERLLALCDVQIRRAKAERVLAALAGNYRAEYLFALRQAVACWEFYHEQIGQCDAEIEALLKQITEKLPPPDAPSQPKPMRHHPPAIDELHLMLLKLSQGGDVTQLSGLSDVSVLELLGEVGTDMSRWPTAKHFTSWLGLAPGKHASGKRQRSQRRRITTRAGQIFRRAAQSLARSKHLALGGFYRRLRARAGSAVANVATARKLAELFYNVLRYGLAYVEQGLERYQQRYEQQLRASLEKRASELGFQLLPLSANP